MRTASMMAPDELRRHTAIEETLRWLDARAKYYDHEASKFLCGILAGRAEECRTTAAALRRQLGHLQDQG